LRRGNRRKKTSQSTKQNYSSLSEAVILAAQQVGEDNRGRDGLLGYLRRIARTEPKLFAALLGRVPPGQIIGKEDRKVRYETYEEVREALLEEGIDVDSLPLLTDMKEPRGRCDSEEDVRAAHGVRPSSAPPIAS
jgi:hypothetical protein